MAVRGSCDDLTASLGVTSRLGEDFVASLLLLTVACELVIIT